MTHAHDTAARTATAAVSAAILIALTAGQHPPLTAQENALTDHTQRPAPNATPNTNTNRAEPAPTTPNNTTPASPREQHTLNTPKPPPAALAPLLTRPINDATAPEPAVILDTFTPPATPGQENTPPAQTLAYRDIVHGQGPPASATDTLTIHIAAAHLDEPQSPAIYRDTQADNTPITLTPADPGLTRALQLTLPGTRIGTTRLIESGPRWNTNLERPGIPANAPQRFALTVISIER